MEIHNFKYIYTVMDKYLRYFLTGLTLGVSPMVLCALFYYVAPMVTGENPGSLLSYGVMGLYATGSLAVFILSIIFIIRDKPIIGAVALFVQIAQLVFAVSFVAGV